MTDTPLLSVRDLHRAFLDARGPFRSATRIPVVNGVSFDLPAGTTLALVGESGSGKSTTARLILRLLDADRGTVFFDGVDWLSLAARELNRRRREIGVVFQDPATSLDPRMTVGEIVAEPLEIHGLARGRAKRDRVAALLDSVGIPASALGKTSREFSGGQRQRIAIARALATEPRLVILDEPVSALDVSIRAQVVNLLSDLQRKTPSRPAYLFIAHDLSLVRAVADSIAVMYLGRIVEAGPTSRVFARPRHPYTALLLASQPRETPREGDREPTRLRTGGEPPSPADPPPGCPFHPRCPSARPTCREGVPREEDGGDGQHYSCFYPLAGP
ncbi:MAG: oligopeptide/dipeptide ABC transporter ATP-binding protein [Thermoanaerobaculia bacterium]